MKNKPYPCLWFDSQANDAADFYCSIFRDSKILQSNDMVVIFEINGQKLMGLNGGPQFKLNEAFSMVIDCDTQAEIDFFWEALTKDGEEGVCGWLKDKFGMSWQVVPSELGKWMMDPIRGQHVVDAFQKMTKMDIETLKNA